MLSFYQRDVLDEILNLIESVSEGFPSYYRLSGWFDATVIIPIIGQQILTRDRLMRANNAGLHQTAPEGAV